MKKTFLQLFLIIFIPCFGYSQNLSLKFKQYSVEDGLSQSWVQCILQDSLGFMWFGTDDGLNRFDGYSFHVYKSNPKNSNSLRNNSIRCMIEDSRGRIWVGTQEGINRFDRATEYFYNKVGWPELQINDILCYKGKLYLATILGLYVIDVQNDSAGLMQVSNNKILTNSIINALALDRQENVWIGTTNGLYVVSLNKDKFYSVSTDLKRIKNYPGKNISSIEIDNNNRIWIGLSGGGLDLIQYSSSVEEAECSSFIHSEANPGSINPGNIRALKADKNGILWIGIENSGLDILKINTLNSSQAQFAHYKSDPEEEKGLSSNSIYKFFEDSRGDIWLGTYGGGINFYNSSGENFLFFKHLPNKKNSLPNGNVNVFYEYEGKIWIGTEGGLSNFDPKKNTFVNFVNKPGDSHTLSSNAVWAITEFDSKIWIGTWSGGINILNPANNQITRLNRRDIVSSNIFAFNSGSDDLLWIATMGGGLYMYEKQSGKINSYRQNADDSKALSNDWVRLVYESANEEIWVSTTTSLDLFDRENDRFIHFQPDANSNNSISGIGADVILEDSRHNLWFGNSSGLNCFLRSDSTFLSYHEEDGLPNNWIKGILEDNSGNLWISTNKGISKMIDGIYLPKKPVFINYDASDGLQGNEFNRRAALKSHDGKMYFGGINGFNVFDPDSIKQNQFVPPIVFTELQVFNKTIELNSDNSPLTEHISIAKEIVLKPHQSVFSIGFVALNYINTEKNKYKYKLEGFDKEWNDIGTQHTATYTNLKPGDYVFRVIASNNDGVWNNESNSIRIKILPPWYRTKLAYSAYLLILMVLILAFRSLILNRARLKHEIQLSQIEKEKQEEVYKLKTRFYTNISHEFRTPLTLIISPLDKIISNHNLTTELMDQLRIMLNNARRMLRLINQFMDTSRIEAGYVKLEVHQGDLAKFIATIAEIFKYNAEEKSIEYIVESNYNSFIGWFDSDKIEKILYNLISNAIKFTPNGGDVKIKTIFNSPQDTRCLNPGYIEIWVTDSGYGIKKEELDKIFDRFYQADNSKTRKHTGTGIGLSLVQGLISKYDGQIEVKSEYGKGTEFYLKLPFTKDKFPEASIVDRADEGLISKIIDEYMISDVAPGDRYSFDNSNADKQLGNLPVLLVVEDNQELRNYIKSNFVNSFKVYEADSGKAALKIAEEKNPDIIISDIMMPEMDGIEMTKLLKNDQKTSHIPIILLTAKASDETHVQGLSIGADAFITKPFSISVLEAGVKNLMESRKNLKKIFSQNIQIEPNDIQVTSVDALFIRKALDLVDRYMDNPDFNVYMMSKEMGMSRALLHTKLVALTGMAPSIFIKNIRLKRAAQLLVEGQLNVSQVIYEIGIKSRSYFTKSFKEMFGLSPTEYVENELKKGQNG